MEYVQKTRWAFFPPERCRKRDREEVESEKERQRGRERERGEVEIEKENVLDNEQGQEENDVINIYGRV